MWVWSLSALASAGQEGVGAQSRGAAALGPVHWGAGGPGGGGGWGAAGLHHRLAGWPLGSLLPLSVPPFLPSLSSPLFTK